MSFGRILVIAVAAVSLAACQADRPAPPQTATPSDSSSPLTPGTPAERVPLATATSPTDPNNCQLLSLADAERLTLPGLKLATDYSNLLGTTPQHGGKVVQHCSYAGDKVRVTYLLQNTDGPAADLLAMRKEDAKSEQEFEVAVGDAAYGHQSGSGAIVDVALGRRLTTVSINADDAAKARTYATEISKHLVDKVLG